MTDAEKVTELDKAVRKLEVLLAHRIETGGRIEFPDDTVRVVLAALSSLRDAAEDAEPEWEYGARRDVLHAKEPASVRSTLQQARESADWYAGLDGVPATLLRRTRAVKAGPWLPVPEGNQ